MAKPGDIITLGGKQYRVVSVDPAYTAKTTFYALIVEAV